MNDKELSLEELSKRIEVVNQASIMVMRAMIERMELLETELIKLKLRIESPTEEENQEEG